MQVKTQPFKEALELKNDGISFNVYGSGAKRLGDLSVTKAGLVWSKTPGGKISAGSGINVKWEEFINWVQSRRAAANKGASSKLSSPVISAIKATSQSSKLAASRPSSGKMPSVAGKLAAQRAAAMKLAASAKQGKPAATKGSAAKPGAKNGAAKSSAIKSSANKFSAIKSSGTKSPSAKSSAVKSAQGQAKSKMLAASRKLSTLKTSAARGKAN